jgi:hypothetical protein
MTVNFRWMRSSLFASVDVMEFQTTEAYSTLALTKVEYNTNMHSRVEKLNVTLRIRPSNFNNNNADQS